MNVPPRIFRRFACLIPGSAFGLALFLLGSPPKATAELLIYDGFPAGGSPGAGQYLTGTLSTNGSNNDSLIGQGPALTGFAAGINWTTTHHCRAACIRERTTRV